MKPRRKAPKRRNRHSNATNGLEAFYRGIERAKRIEAYTAQAAAKLPLFAAVRAAIRGDA